MKTHVTDKATGRAIVNPKATYAVVYIGAPYGDNEGGHIVEVCATRVGAEQARRRMGELKSREHVIVALDAPTTSKRWSFGDVTTPRQYFNLG